MARPRGKPDAATRVRKNMDMDAKKLAAAQRILGTVTETETVDLALEYVVTIGSEFAALDRLAALGGLDDPFGERAKPRRVAER
jgi:Arc/MetJ family transcription regulator